MAPFLFSDSFEAYLSTEKRYSDHTLLAYMKDIAQFFEFCGQIEKNELSEINSKLIRGWLVSLKDEKFTNKTVNRKLSSLRTYFNFLKRNQLITRNPLTGINGPKSEKRLPQFANEEDLVQNPNILLANNSFSVIRDLLMIELLYQTGMRLSELIGLKVNDIQNCRVKVLGKRNKERLIPISKELNDLINEYLQFKNAQEFDSHWLINTNSGNKVYPKFVYRKINIYLGDVTDLEKCSPHVLRHTFATHMLNNGAGLETIKELLGHANLSATQVYTHSSFAQLTNIYSQAHPRGQKNK